MKVFYFIRHGETAWNTIRRYQGHLNSPLTENGIRMAHKVCELIAKEPLPAVLRVMASPQKRAMETAEVFKQYFKIDLHNDDRLREVSLGSWDGLSNDEIIARFPDLQLDKNNQEWYFRSPDGETFEQAKKRAKEFLIDLEQMESRTCILSHGLIGRILMGVYAGADDKSMLHFPTAQDSFYRLTGGKVEAVGQNTLNKCFA